MNDEDIASPPPSLDAIRRDAAALGFIMSCESKTGALLRALAAAKPNGRLLELGTGTGFGAAWLLAGMDRGSTLVSVDNDAQVQAVARRHLAADERVTFVQMDAAAYLEQAAPDSFDLIYADAGPGKFSQRDRALSLLKAGGIYFVDDLLPQRSWPAGHAPRVPRLIEELSEQPGFVALQLAWASGLMILVKTGQAVR
jgi:predicted O-methyltransferase YrrM